MERTVGTATRGVTATAVALGLGVLSGALGAYGYYQPFLRPLAHSFSLWIDVLIVVSAGRSVWRAMVAGTAALMAAVVTFYVGKKVMYGVRYPGMPYAVNLSELVLWIVLAVVAGCGLGWVVHHVGRPGPPGARAAAAVVALLVADVARRAVLYPGIDVVTVAVAAVAGVLLVFRLTREHGRPQLRHAAVIAVPATAAAVVVLSLPDLVEQLVLI